MMEHEIHASVVVKLPAQGRELAQAVATFAAAWAEMLARAGEARAQFSVNEVRSRGVRRRRGRPRAVEAPTLPLPELVA